MTRTICYSLCLFFSFIVTPHIGADDLDHIAFEGVVTDATGAAIVGADITVRHTTTNRERSTLSDQTGRYRIAALAPGEYELLVKMMGFRPLRLPSVRAAAGTTVRQDFKLEVAQVEAQVTIEGSGEQTLVDPSRTVVGGTLTRQQIDELPIESRNVFDLIFTLAGVSLEAFSLRDLAEGDTKDRFRSTPEEAGVFALNGGTPF